MTTLPPQLRHGEIREVLSDVFFVMGESRPEFGGRSFQFSRNMTIIRERNALTLVNTMRLDADGLARLDALGKVEHIVKLGFFHGRDDAFYVKRYGAKVWAFPDTPHERGVTTGVELVPGQAGPLSDAQVFDYESASIAEGLLLLERHGGVLLACDSLQNWSDPDEYFDEKTAAVMRPHGFHRGVVVGPGFLNRGKPQPGDFARLKALPFRHMLSAHGEPLLDDANKVVGARLEELFGV